MPFSHPWEIRLATTTGLIYFPSWLLYTCKMQPVSQTFWWQTYLNPEWKTYMKFLIVLSPIQRKSRLQIGNKSPFLPQNKQKPAFVMCLRASLKWQSILIEIKEYGKVLDTGVEGTSDTAKPSRKGNQTQIFRKRQTDDSVCQLLKTATFAC